MTTLYLLLSLLFGADVRDLGHHDYHTRESAHRRLVAAGPLAAPLVYPELQSPIPEVVARASRIVGGYGTVGSVLAKLVVESGADIPDSFLLPLGPEISTYIETLDIWDAHYRLDWTWVQRLPYRTSSLVGDLRLSITEANQRRRPERVHLRRHSGGV